MAMKKSKGKGVSAPEPTASGGQMKMAQRAIKNPATLKKVATGGKGASAPKPSASSGQMKMAQRPIKVLGKIGSGKGKK